MLGELLTSVSLALGLAFGETECSSVQGLPLDSGDGPERCQSIRHTKSCIFTLQPNMVWCTVSFRLVSTFLCTSMLGGIVEHVLNLACSSDV